MPGPPSGGAPVRASSAGSPPRRSTCLRSAQRVMAALQRQSGEAEGRRAGATGATGCNALTHSRGGGRALGRPLLQPAAEFTTTNIARPSLVQIRAAREQGAGPKQECTIAWWSRVRAHRAARGNGPSLGSSGRADATPSEAASP
eukprot:scaffold4449_cov93-Isochrysis_galbana.AAC.2